MKLTVYEYLLEMNRGFDQVVRSLKALQRALGAKNLIDHSLPPGSSSLHSPPRRRQGSLLNDADDMPAAFG